MRALSMLSSVRGELLAGAAVTPLAALIRRDGLVQRRCVEVRPEQIGEIELRVRDLPKQEVGNALLAAGAYEKVGLRRVGHREERLERLRFEAAGGLRPRRDQPLRRLGDVPAPAIVRGDGEGETPVIRGQRLARG